MLFLPALQVRVQQVFEFGHLLVLDDMLDESDLGPCLDPVLPDLLALAPALGLQVVTGSLR